MCSIHEFGFMSKLEAIKSSAKDLSLPIFEIAIDHKVRMLLQEKTHVDVSWTARRFCKLYLAPEVASHVSS
jgi:hypothetical protein